VHPLPDGPLLPLGVFASFTSGSTGTQLARADRATGALVWQGRTVRGGAAFTHAWGVGANGAQKSIIGDAFVRVEPIPRLLLGARASYWIRNTASDATDTTTTLTGTAGWRFGDPLETFLAVTRSIPSTFAESAEPGNDYWDLRLVARVVF